MSVLTAVVVSSLVATPASAAVFNATVANSTGTLAAGTLVLRAAASGGTCTSSGAAITSDAATCITGSPFAAGPLTTSPSSVTTALSQLGSVSPTAANVRLDACGAAAVATAAGAKDAGLLYNAVTYARSGPSTVPGSAVSLAAATHSYIATTAQASAPATATIVAWFKTTSPTGVIAGFSSAFGATSTTTADRALWLQAGKLHFGYKGSFGFGRRSRTFLRTVSSSSAYDNGTWHMAAASFTSAGVTLWADGTKVATTGFSRTLASYTGSWHIGFDPITGRWPTAPGIDYFNGSLARVAVVPGGLSTAQLAALYAASPSTYTTQLAALHPSESWPLDDTGTSPYTTSIPALSLTGGTTYADVSGHANTATPHGAVSATSAGPLGGSAVTLAGPGTKTSVTTYLSTPNTYTTPAPLSIVAWFKAPTAGYGGNIIGFTSSPTSTQPTEWDRQIWMDPTGHLVFGIYPTKTEEVTSPSTYNDGAWHMVVASYGAGGEQLWVDGTKVAQKAPTATTQVTRAQSFLGWWHLGFSHSTTGWADGPTRPTWAGTLAQIAVVPGQLTATKIAALATASTASSYRADVLALSPSSYWPLGATASHVASGLCSAVNTTVSYTLGATTTCVYPQTSGSCGTPSSPLGSLASVSIPPDPVGTTASVTTSLAVPTNPTPQLVGLHIVTDLSFVESVGSWSASVSYPGASTLY